jgi:aerobic-type carbon monoxide dehydrogenase small subunit (CoxS/CutS family)
MVSSFIVRAYETREKGLRSRFPVQIRIRLTSRSETRFFPYQNKRISIDPVRRKAAKSASFEKANVRFVVNGESVEAAFSPHKTLLEVLREDLALIGTKHGCELGECGTCAVLVDGEPVLSCLYLGLECEGRRVETVEGMAGPDGLHPLQKAFADLGAAQCGYCTPGFLLTARALLERNPKPTLPEIRDALAGNLCRCTGYVKIFEAVELAAAWMRGEDAQPRRESLYGFDFDESGLLPVVKG